MDMGVEETKVDPNVWRWEARKGSGDIYYELLLVYVDDILCVSHDPRPILDSIDSFYSSKLISALRFTNIIYPTEDGRGACPAIKMSRMQLRLLRPY